MDNKEIVEKVLNLMAQIEKLKTENGEKDELIYELQAQINGDRVCSPGCEGCKHVVKIPTLLGSISYDCKLKYNCKDFEKERQNGNA